MGWGSVFGLVVAFGGVLAGQLMEGGHVGSLVQSSALCIVISGTLGAVMLQSGPRTCADAFKMLGRLVRVPADSSIKGLPLLSRWAEIARKDGLLKLEGQQNVAPNKFYQRGLTLLIDGFDVEMMEELLHSEITACEQRLKRIAKVWESAGGYSPTIGILGAVLGLIHVMENLTDPSKLGAGIAVAFVATIYGVAFANLVFLPVGNALKAAVGAEIRAMETAAECLIDLAKGRAPRDIEMRIAISIAEGG